MSSAMSRLIAVRFFLVPALSGLTVLTEA